MKPTYDKELLQRVIAEHKQWLRILQLKKKDVVMKVRSLSWEEQRQKEKIYILEERLKEATDIQKPSNDESAILEEFMVIRPESEEQHRALVKQALAEIGFGDEQ